MEKNDPLAGRLLALDVMRGATILGMILVNNPGRWTQLYAPLGHAPWYGWTTTDLIFPFFLFMVGVAMAYSFRKFEDSTAGRGPALRKVIQRTIMLILLGLLLNSSGRWLGLLFGEWNGFNFNTLRLPGVLQRIALAYFGASLIVLFCGPTMRIVWGAVLLIGYAEMLLLLPLTTPFEERLTPAGNIVRVVDLAILGPNHMYTQAQSELTDPEGLLSTLPSIVTALLGFAVGKFLQTLRPANQKVMMLIAVGAAVAVLGQVWGWLDPALGGMPINKKLWTSSFVLLTAGLGTVALAVCLWLFDVLGEKSLSLRTVGTAFQVVGVNAIFAFVASGIGARLFSMIPWGDSNLRDAYYQTLFVGPLGDTKLASLGFASSVVAFWWIVLWVMCRRGWVWKV
jgi:predicted acyltransferase